MSDEPQSGASRPPESVPLDIATVLARLDNWKLEAEERRAADAADERERAAEEVRERERHAERAKTALAQAIERDLRGGWYISERTPTSARLHRPRRGWGPFFGFGYGEQGPSVRFRRYALAPYEPRHVHYFERCQICTDPRNHSPLLVWNDPPEADDSPPET